MKSIRVKFLQLNLISILLCALLVGGIGLWSTSTLLSESSKDILNLTCRAEGDELDEVLHDIQDSVDTFCQLADSQVSSLIRLRNDSFLDTFYNEVERFMLEIASRTRGVCACYFLTAPELTRTPAGFLYSVDAGSETLSKKPLTDLSLYDPLDTSHVGWYYQPQISGHSLWMEPYYNKNLDINMISYVCPLYRDGVFWGIAGMDINFDVVIERVRSVRPYETGYACLISDSGSIYYHPELSAGSCITDYSADLQPVLEAFSRSQGENAEPVSFLYRYNGVSKVLSSYRLSNGMELLLVARLREINAPMVSLFRFISLTTLALCTVVILFVISASNHITRPLEKLTRAAEEIANGNMDVELPPAGEDEVGILTNSLAVTVASLKQHIDYMYNMAYSDPLTHVKNKTAYDKESLELQERMQEGDTAFGMLMLDLNSLKAINDQYGHERGDEYLIACCRLMCRVFKRSPVFRIGGDEFLILLRGEDLNDITVLLEELERHMEKTLKAEEPWKRLSIAKGLSFCTPEDQTPDAVLKRADEAMYIDKRRMKERALL